MTSRTSGYLVPLPDDKWLLHAPLQQVAALVDSATADCFTEVGKKPSAAVNELKKLLETAVVKMPAAKTGNLDPHFLGITTTRGCNIGCVYCNFGGPTANNAKMQPAVAMAAVDYMRDRLLDANRDLFRVHFFGGEPLIAWNLIELVVHRVRYLCDQHGWDNYIDASTNGVMSDERLKFVGDYFGGVVLSFDGPPEFHDRNRPTKRGKSTFAAVDHAAKTWRDMPVDLCLRVCVTEASVDSMEEIAEWMCETYDPTVINFETLTHGDLAQNAGLQVPDPHKFARGCIGAYRVARRRGIRAVYSAAEYAQPRQSFCPVGTDSPIVAPDGTINACYLLEQDWQERGLDMTVGHINAAAEVQLEAASVDRIRKIPGKKDRCNNCFCKWSCAGGCHVNQTYPDASDGYTDFCEQTRLVTACLILDELGYDELVDALLADDSAMKRASHCDRAFEIVSNAAAGADSVLPQRQVLHESMAVLQ